MAGTDNLRVVVDVEFAASVTLALLGETIIGLENATNMVAVPFRLSMLVKEMVEPALPPWGKTRNEGEADSEKSGPITLT